MPFLPSLKYKIKRRAHHACCICQFPGVVEIHHIIPEADKGPSTEDNAAPLCPTHHEEFGGNPTKRKMIREIRDIWYDICLKKEQNHDPVALEILSQMKNIEARPEPLPIIPQPESGGFKKELTEEDFLRISKNAIIILELDKIKEGYYTTNSQEEKYKILFKIGGYSSHSNPRLDREIFSFLLDAAHSTRGGMTETVAGEIFGLVLSFAPRLQRKEGLQQSIELASTCIHIADAMTYDATVYLKDLRVARWSLTILKFIYTSAKRNNITELLEEINQTYDHLESALLRPDQGDLSKSKEMVKIFRADLDKGDLSFPSDSFRLAP